MKDGGGDAAIDQALLCKTWLQNGSQAIECIPKVRTVLDTTFGEGNQHSDIRQFVIGPVGVEKRPNTPKASVRDNLPARLLK